MTLKVTGNHTTNQKHCKHDERAESTKYSCGTPSLDVILSKIEQIDLEACQPVGRDGEIKPPSEKDYVLRGIEQILRTADMADTPLVNYNGKIYCYTGAHYKEVDEWVLKKLVIEAATRAY